MPPVELPLWPIVRPLQAAVLIAPVNLHPHDRGVVVVGASLEPRAHDNVRFRGKKAAPEPKRSVRTLRCFLPSCRRALPHAVAAQPWTRIAIDRARPTA